MTKRPAKKRNNKAAKQKTWKSWRPIVWLAGVWSGIKERSAKNPHKTFRRTDKWAKRRRELKLPGYFRFFGDTCRAIWKVRKTFWWLLFAMTVSQIIFVGLLSTETITTFQSALQDTGGDFGAVSRAGFTLIRTISTGGVDEAANENGAAIRILTILIMWLATVVILRQSLAGNKIKMRDALYTCGAPIMASVGVLIVMVFQALPILISMLLYNAAVATEFLRSPFTGIVFFVFVGCLVLFSVFWLVQSILALVIVTMPGTYPVSALHIAGDLIRGRRVRLILRMLFLIVILAVLVVILMIPLIMLFGWLGGLASWINAIPILPTVLVFVTCAAVIFSAAYVYLLYRGLLESERHAKK
jgi:hypothetical protein